MDFSLRNKKLWLTLYWAFIVFCLFNLGLSAKMSYDNRHELLMVLYATFLGIINGFSILLFRDCIRMLCSYNKSIQELIADTDKIINHPRVYGEELVRVAQEVREKYI